MAGEATSYSFQNNFNLVYHLVVPKSNHTIPQLFQILCPIEIRLSSESIFMNLPIQLND